MTEKFEVIVIGSGFGGAVTSCRLSEAGARVLILERGRRWTPGTYPRKAGDPWLFHPAHPHKHNGWLDVRLFPRMIVTQGAGVGGGSLCYSSVVMPADPDRFRTGWPPEVTHEALLPYYERVRQALALNPVPPGQRTARANLLRRAADTLGYGSRFEDLPLAISFDPEFSYARPNALDANLSRHFVNAHGATQGTCVHLGNCDIGCDVQAKNTLDLNYIYTAERHGAQVRPLHVVRRIEPAGTGYRVVWDEIRDGGMRRGSAEADRVVIAAGSLGTTEILLRCRDEHRTLAGISARLGSGWSANANVLAPAIYPHTVDVKQGIGPTISAGLNFLDGTESNQRFFVEDDGFPNLLLNALSARLDAGGIGMFSGIARRWLRRSLTEHNPTEQVMIWLGEGIDAGSGRLSLGPRKLKPWQRELKLRWSEPQSRAVIDAIGSMHRRLAQVDGGRLRSPLLLRLLRTSLTVHPLGGCAMGSSAADGVVDHRGEVFGYPRLYVADGSLLPRPTGRNPSMTIAALAERVADMITHEG